MVTDALDAQTSGSKTMNSTRLSIWKFFKF